MLLMVTVGYCQAPLSSQEDFSLFRKKISEIENRCTPQTGTSRQEVERIFGEGNPASNKKLGVIESDSPYRSYVLCVDGTLFVQYSNDKVVSAHYLDPFAAKGRPLGVKIPIEEELQEAKHRLKQMEMIETVYSRKILPLRITIKAEKQVYQEGEPINIIEELKNVSNKRVKVGDYYKPIGLSFYFKNQYGEKCELGYVDIIRRIMPTEMTPGQSISPTGTTTSLPNNITSSEGYRIKGRHVIYAEDGGLTSDSIFIDLVENTSKYSGLKDSDYQSIAKRICERVVLLKDKYPDLTGIKYTPPNEKGEGELSFEYGVHRDHPKPVDPPKLQGMITTYDQGGFEFKLYFYRGQWMGAAVFMPYEFGDLKLWYQYGHSGETEVITEIAKIINEERKAFDKKYHSVTDIKSP